MDCLYINIDGETSRQQRIEENFQQVPHTNWTLVRLGAVDAKQVAASRVEGKLRPAEKGCFLSHIKAIDLCRSYGAHTLIVEDDVLFGKNTFASIETAINSVSEQGWDIIFTDVCIPSLQTMIQLYFMRRTLNAGHPNLLNLNSGMPFGGSTAYLVNRHSVDKILSALKTSPALDVPYDLALKELFNHDHLNGYVVFPFLTSLSDFADASQIQFGNASQVSEIVWNSFRRLVWAERSLDTATGALDRVAAEVVDAESAAFCKIIGCLLSSKYKEKG